MSVYVDQLQRVEARGSEAHRAGAKHGHYWCHMIADSLDELHAMADRLGLKRSWFQPESFPHYDLVPHRRAAAVRLGAVDVDRKRLVQVMERFRSRSA